ncbi:hypothetical protein [Stenoxybacter acetivorans]|uniref:hypothetical protein n=1 Tax=Stenoxybacter acetivorans TaxID=422441 RepID=UPI00056CAD77|nr:hypothetical protein [Stenoxybacter acetivorans]
MNGKMGELIKIYKPRKVWIIGLAAVSIIIVIGLLLWLAAYAVSNGGINYRGDGDPVLLLAGIGAVLVGGGAFYAYHFVRRIRGKIIFELYENGIVMKPVKAKQGNAEPMRLLFAEIEDILPLTIVSANIADAVYITHLAFRKNPSSEWFWITPQTSGHKKLNEQFVELHTQQRGALIFDQWQKTYPSVQIRYIDKSARRSPNLAKNAAEFLKPFDSFKTLLLAKNYINIDNQTISFDSTYTVEFGGWTDNIYLKDGGGKEKFRIDASTILSADIFVALLFAQIGDNAEE